MPVLMAAGTRRRDSRNRGTFATRRGRPTPLHLPRHGTNPGSVKAYDVQPQTRDTQATAVTETVLPAREIGPWLEKAYRALTEVIAAHGTSPSGPPFARYHRLEAGRVAVEAGFPVVTAIEPDGDVRPSYLPGGPAVATIHVGAYEEIAPAYSALAAWVTGHGGKPAGDAWESYLSDPTGNTDPSAMRTEVVQPYEQA
jgi:effector-binding domain-containing protein